MKDFCMKGHFELNLKIEAGLMSIGFWSITRQVKDTCHRSHSGADRTS